MLDLFLCVIMNVGIFVSFRSFSVFKMDTLQAIVFNYITCVITGLVFTDDFAVLEGVEADDPWLIIALTLGVVFIGTFYLMAITTQKFSMTVSSIASKMSLVIPVLISLFLLGIQSKDYTWINYAGMVMALTAILMSSYKKGRGVHHPSRIYDLALPFLVFLFGGIIDASINYTNYHFLTPQQASIFPLFIFCSAAIIGSGLLIFRRRKPDLKSFTGGVVLGVINYFSIYFLITSLNFFQNDGAIVYPLVNVGIVIFSSAVSVLFFKEKLTALNKTGLFFAVVAIICMSYQEIASAI